MFKWTQSTHLTVRDAKAHLISSPEDPHAVKHCWGRGQEDFFPRVRGGHWQVKSDDGMPIGLVRHKRAPMPAQS